MLHSGPRQFISIWETFSSIFHKVPFTLKVRVQITRITTLLFWSPYYKTRQILFHFQGIEKDTQNHQVALLMPDSRMEEKLRPLKCKYYVFLDNYPSVHRVDNEKTHTHTRKISSFHALLNFKRSNKDQWKKESKERKWEQMLRPDTQCPNPSPSLTCHVTLSIHLTSLSLSSLPWKYGIVLRIDGITYEKCP